MFRATLKNKEKDLSWQADFETEHEAKLWANAQMDKPNRLGERVEPFNPALHPKFVIEEFTTTDEWGIETKYQRLKPEVELKIVNLEKNKDWVINRTRERRMKAYPTLLEAIEALLENEEGRPDKLNALKLKRMEVKAKFPLAE